MADNWLRQSLIVLLLCVELLGNLGKHHWLLDILSHFQVQYLGAGLVLFLWSLARRGGRWTGMALLAVLHSCFMVAPWIQLPASKTHGKSLRVMAANVFCGNTQHLKLVQSLLDADADVIALTELTQDWQRSLDTLREGYPFHQEVPRSGAFGIGLYSRYPLADVQVHYLGSADVPTIQARLEISTGNWIRMMATHPLPPYRDYCFHWRNEQLDLLAKRIQATEGPWIVAGDLNVTQWSPWHAHFESVSGLVNCRRHRGLLPTWPDLNWFFRIPIDHILASSEITCSEFADVILPGSDHRAVRADLVIPEQF